MKKEVKHRHTLNQRQRLFTSQMVKTNGNKTQSMVNAGYSPGYVEGAKNNLLQNPLVKQDYERKYIRALKKAGVDDEVLAEVTREGLLANKVFTFQGQVIEPDKPVPDHFIRQKFLDTANKVRGDFAPEQHEHSLKRETAEEAFRQRIQKRQELEEKMNGGALEAKMVEENRDKPKDKQYVDKLPLAVEEARIVDVEVVDEDSKEAENESEVTHKKDDLNEGS